MLSRGASRFLIHFRLIAPAQIALGKSRNAAYRDMYFADINLIFRARWSVFQWAGGKFAFFDLRRLGASLSYVALYPEK